MTYKQFNLKMKKKNETPISLSLSGRRIRLEVHPQTSVTRGP